HSNRQASRHFRVSPRFVNNLMKLKAETGSLEARRQGHGVGGGKLAGHAEFVRQRIKQNGDLTLDELCIELEGRGVAFTAPVWECQDFRVWSGIMGKQGVPYVSTQRA